VLQFFALWKYSSSPGKPPNNATKVFDGALRGGSIFDPLNRLNIGTESGHSMSFLSAVVAFALAETLCGAQANLFRESLRPLLRQIRKKIRFAQNPCPKRPQILII
jgi:hypothetical protein